MAGHGLLTSLHFQQGKRQLKIVSRSLRAASGSPRAFKGASFVSSPLNARAPRSFARRYATLEGSAAQPIPFHSAASAGPDPSDNSGGVEHQTAALVIPETQRLKPSWLAIDRTYGSIVGTPPRPPPLPPPALELPGPAIDPTNGFEASESHAPSNSEPSPSQHQKVRAHRRLMSLPGGGKSPARALPYPVGWSSNKPANGISPDGRRDFDVRHARFSEWMDGELGKVEAFYKMKETEATERLHVLRAQLHEMRDRRMEEIAAQKAKEQSQEGDDRSPGDAGGRRRDGESTHSDSITSGWLGSVGSALGITRGKTARNPGKATRAMQVLGTPETPLPADRARHNARIDSRSDYTRRKTSEIIPYRQAKRKLKRALQEYYRSLELLKSYALLNRTAFRKLNKKYDKALNARPTGRYMSEKVNKSHFVQSEVLDAHLVAAEDLYARYFERGSHKVAVGKLRSKSGKSTEYYGSVYRNGLLLGAGLVFGIQGLVSGAAKLSDPDVVVRVNTSYLLQIYAGLFLSVLLFLSFVVNCKIWEEAKINYVFIFEFDTQHNLDWRQLAELPSLFICLEGFFVWLNFQVSGSNRFYLYYPVILIGLVVAIIFFPAPSTVLKRIP
ncbi:MAG: hypothetical protein M1839_001118 [Geoglossum umbratile]|nr:MAG: hypothetical protein M1839_001118 [Geoglossum umbratile]